MEALGGNLRFIVTGGAACQVRLIRIFTAAGIPIYEGYGPTGEQPRDQCEPERERRYPFRNGGPGHRRAAGKTGNDGEICVKAPV